MAGILPEIFGHFADRQLAKQSATEIARLLGSKRVANQSYVIGEPFCPYKIPMHADEFWCTVFVSDTTYVFRGNHKRPTKEIYGLQDLSVHLKVRRSYWGVRNHKCLTRLSNELSVPMYANRTDDENFIRDVLLSKAILKHLQRIDFSIISEMHISQLQLSATCCLRSPTHCVEQVKIFQNLLIALFGDSQKRHQTG
jgi:hypothetical protein